MVCLITLFTFLTTVGSECCAESGDSPRAIGVVLPLSGALHEYGEPVKNGILFARSKFETSLVRFIFEDSMSDTKGAISAYEKLVNTGVEAVIVWGTTASEGVAPVAMQRGVPIFSMSMSPAVSRARPLVTRTSPDATLLVVPVVKEIQRIAPKSIALITAEWSFTIEQSKALHAAFPEGFIEEHLVTRSELDFRGLILKLKTQKKGLIGVLLGPGQLGEFYRQMRDLRVEIPTFSTSILDSKAERAKAGSSAKGAFYADYIVCPNFRESFLKFDASGQYLSYAVNAFDVARLLLTSAETTPGKEKLYDYVQNNREFRGVCGSMMFRDGEASGGYFDYPVSLQVVP